MLQVISWYKDIINSSIFTILVKIFVQKFGKGVKSASKKSRKGVKRAGKYNKALNIKQRGYPKRDSLFLIKFINILEYRYDST